MITKILVAIDGSKMAEKAVKQSIDLAKQTKATITLLSVIDNSALVAQYVPAEMSFVNLVQPIEQYLRNAAQRYIERARKLCEKNGLTSSGVIRDGHPVEEILREAKKSKASIIVVGSHGKGTIESAVLGSVTYGVIHKNTKYPVLVVR